MAMKLLATIINIELKYIKLKLRENLQNYLLTMTIAVNEDLTVFGVCHPLDAFCIINFSTLFTYVRTNYFAQIANKHGCRVVSAHNHWLSWMFFLLLIPGAGPCRQQN